VILFLDSDYVRAQQRWSAAVDAFSRPDACQVHWPWLEMGRLLAGNGQGFVELFPDGDIRDLGSRAGPEGVAGLPAVRQRITHVVPAKRFPFALTWGVVQTAVRPPRVTLWAARPGPQICLATLAALHGA